MARTYKRDGNGRFAGGGGGSSGGGKRPAAKPVSRGVNRLTRDNAGKITSVGGEGATARGGRLKTAAGNKRAMQTAKVSGGSRAGTIKGKVKRDTGAAGKVGQGKAATPTPKPAAAAAKPATPKPAAKLPREQRLARATATASRIAKKRKQAADETGAAFAERRRISGRASSKARSSAFAKEAVAGKQSASALQSFQRADNRESNLIAALGRERQAARTGAPKPAAATTAKPSARKADLSPSAFKRRAEVADVRARFAESNVQGLDRANPKNRRAFNRADNMRNAANNYSSILKRSQSSEFSPAQIFNSRRKYSTNPKQTSSEKAAITKANNKMKTFEKNVKAQERARRFR